MEPDRIVAAYEEEIAAVAARAEEAKDRIRNLTGSATSPDGAVTVTVGGGGALQDVSFGKRAYELPREQLAAAIMATARRAQAQASQRILAAMEPLVGADSDAMRFVRDQIPSPEEPRDEVEESYPGQHDLEPDPEPADPPQPAAPAAPAVSPRTAPRPPAAADQDEDEDFESDSPLSREERW